MNLQDIEAATGALLRALGDDVSREGLQDTPQRVARAWEEICAGYSKDPADVLSTAFDSGGYDEMIVVGPVDFYSTCEHHLLPFHGVAFVGYVPEQKVIGLSKLPRLVDVFARRLQIQERMTQQIADAIEEHLQPKGLGVLVRAQHLCTCSRGVSKPRVMMTTTALAGVMRQDNAARAEFLKETDRQ